MSLQKQWTKEQKLKFVQEYVKRQSVFDTGNKNETKDRKILRNDILTQISKSMQITGFGPKEAYSKLRNIKSTYAQELKKIRKAAAHGKRYIPNVIWFKTLDKAIKKQNSTKEYMAMLSSEGNEMEAASSLLNATNEDYTVKIELLEDEIPHANAAENCQEYSEKEKQHPKTEIINVPLYGEVQNYENYTGTMDNNSDNASDNGDRMPGITNHKKNEFDVFGESIAAQLKNMPLVDALEAEMYIQNYLCNLRLRALRFQNSC